MDTETIKFVITTIISIVPILFEFHKHKAESEESGNHIVSQNQNIGNIQAYASDISIEQKMINTEYQEQVAQQIVQRQRKDARLRKTNRLGGTALIFSIIIVAFCIFLTNPNFRIDKNLLLIRPKFLLNDFLIVCNSMFCAMAIGLSISTFLCQIKWRNRKVINLVLQFLIMAICILYYVGFPSYLKVVSGNVLNSFLIEIPMLSVIAFFIFGAINSVSSYITNKCTNIYFFVAIINIAVYFFYRGM